jgi:chromatin-remodeling ATPase INO80
LRAKKLHREMIVYWRKRERELNEVKKRKLKLEEELKKRQEEEEEAIK